MSLILSRVLAILGILLLSHSCYSAYEQSKLQATIPPYTTQPSSSTRVADLPPDILFETVFSVLLICTGLVLGAEGLQPISWRVWAGEIENTKKEETPFKVLEDRMGFLDIRVKRKQFADWVRKGEKDQK